MYVSFNDNKVGLSFDVTLSQEMIESFNFSSVEWDMSSEKRQVEIYRKDRSLYVLIHSKKVYIHTTNTSYVLNL